MSSPTLLECRPPWVVVTRSSDPWVSAQERALRARGASVVRLSGTELREPATLFAAFARELSFPGYFGHNWYALVDCLHDWHGHGADSRDLAVLIDGADVLAEAEFLGLLIAILCEAAWRANLQLDADGIPHTGSFRQPFALHFVLLVDATAPETFAAHAATDPDVHIAVTDGRLTATMQL
jgi:hypothetical protein